MSVLKETDNFNWLLIEWKSGCRNVVHVKSLVSPLDEDLKPGDVIKLNWRGEQETAALIAHAQDRASLDAMVKESVPDPGEAGPSFKTEAGSGGSYDDYSSSESSWVPSDDEDESADSDVGDTSVKPKMIKYEIPTANNSNYCKRRHTSLTKLMSIGNLLSDSTKWQNGEELQNEEQVLAKMAEVKDAVTKIFTLIDNFKWKCMEEQNSKTNIEMLAVEQLSETSNEQSVHEDDDDHSDDLNRSTDNVLITNKCYFAERNEPVEDEWIPIGSGKTLIHKDKFRKVNWRSSNLATRTLLVATFPKRILATHSLTGKKSPAFQEKPAKMCLDPKIISDIIIEVMERFNVKENQVRKIITNKCADECKMSKTRKNKRKSENDENVPPGEDMEMDEENDN